MAAFATFLRLAMATIFAVAALIAPAGAATPACGHAEASTARPLAGVASARCGQPQTAGAHDGAACLACAGAATAPGEAGVVLAPGRPSFVPHGEERAAGRNIPPPLAPPRA